MKKEAYEILKTAVAEHREQLLSGRQMCLGLLRDFGGREHPEVNLFADAVEENIPDRLIRSQPVTQQIIDSLAGDFASNRFYDNHAAKFVVSSWADALGLYSLEPSILTNARTNTEPEPKAVLRTDGRMQAVEKIWYYQDGANTIGPLMESQLMALSNSGTLPATTLVWSDGMAAWEPVSIYFPRPSMPPQIPAARQKKDSRHRNLAPSPNTPTVGYSPHDTPHSPPRGSHDHHLPPKASQLSWIKILWSFQGRIPRRIYWQATGYWIGALFIASMLSAASSDSEGPGFFFGLFMLAFCWSSFALQVKRWQDRDKSGMMVLINLLPYIGWIWTLIECGCLRGTVGDNKFGKDPT